MTTGALTRRLIPILHDDGTLLAVAKPAGVDTGSYEGRSTLGVQELLQAQGGLRLIPINRLSRYESGILLFARAAGLTQALKNALRNGEVTQEFVAVAKGRTKGRKLVIDSVHGASRGRSRRKKEPRKDGPQPGEATAVEVLKATDERVMVRCRTTVDNTHALRAQLRAAGLSVLGDRTPGKFQREPRYAETCLHLAKIVFTHPDRAAKTTIHSPVPPAFEVYLRKDPDWTRAFHAALVRRIPLLEKPNSNAYRVLSGHAEDVPGMTIEKYADLAIIRAESGPVRTIKTLKEMARWLRDGIGVSTVVLRTSEKGEPSLSESADLADGTVLLGEPAPADVTISEFGLNFLVRPAAPSSPGLFLDQRDNRQRVRGLSKGKDVLNLFAYTCGFSVAAAAGGAQRTVSVDLSPRNIEWGRENFARNGLAGENHLFFSTHVAQFLKRAIKEKEQYDVIIIDPPSFAHGRRSGQDFSVERDLAGLLTSTIPVLRKGGIFLVSMNLRRMSWRAFRERVNAGLSGRRIIKLEELPLPIDFAVDPDHSKTLLVHTA